MGESAAAKAETTEENAADVGSFYFSSLGTLAPSGMLDYAQWKRRADRRNLCQVGGGDGSSLVTRYRLFELLSGPRSAVIEPMSAV